MASTEPILLTRECEAVVIPSGERVALEVGTPVSITQSLGGSYTVMAGGRLMRIDGKDADALGLTPSVRSVLGLLSSVA